MGTSGSFGGPTSATPLVPTWLDSDPVPAPGDAAPPESTAPVEGTTGDGSSPASPAPPVASPAPAPHRFSAARGNLSRYAGSGARDRASLGRAIAGYVSTASGGAHNATRRMGASRVAGARLLGFLADASARGPAEALRALHLESLAGRSVEDVFLGLLDYVCPDGGTVDDGIAREAFIETIAELAENGVVNLDAFTPDQMQTVFELLATHSIEARLCNDIGSTIVTLPVDVSAAKRVEAQLRDFIRRAVSDALAAARDRLEALTVRRVMGFVSEVYEAAFDILQAAGETEAQ